MTAEWLHWLINYFMPWRTMDHEGEAALSGDETTEFEITIHRATPIPGTDALLGYSDDRPDKQFLITPKASTLTSVRESTPTRRN